MGFLSRFARHTDLVNGMAGRLGASPDRRIAADPEAEATRLRAMVLRCTTCQEPAACAALQARHTQLDTAPAYCRNRGLLAQLADDDQR